MLVIRFRWKQRTKLTDYLNSERNRLSSLRVPLCQFAVPFCRTTADRDEVRKAAERNTRWLFKTYFTPIDIRTEVVKPAIAAFTTEHGP